MLDSTVTISETVNNTPPLCTVTASFQPALVGGVFTLTTPTSVGVNEVMVTNTVVCQTRLTLEKDPQGGTAEPDEWTLDAIAPSGAAAGPSGVSGTGPATAPITPNVTYPLAEQATTPLAATYVQSFQPTLQDQWGPNRAAGATGSWVCVVATSVDGRLGVPTWSGSQFDGRNGGVTVLPGQWAKCTAVNQPKPTLELVKRVSINGVLTDQGIDQWTLNAAWTAPATATSRRTPERRGR